MRLNWCVVPAGGVVDESENPAALAQAADDLTRLDPAQLQHMGQQARRFYQEHLSLAVGVEQFSALFKRLARKC